jgi:hypothetical protein
MVSYLRRQEALVRQALESGPGDRGWEELATYHGHQISYLQHERLVHLLVTLFFGLFALISALRFVAEPGTAMAALVLLFLLLLVPYVVHYFQLENGVQRFYELANEIDQRADRVAASHRC